MRAVKEKQVGFMFTQRWNCAPITLDFCSRTDLKALRERGLLDCYIYELEGFQAGKFLKDYAQARKEGRQEEKEEGRREREGGKEREAGREGGKKGWRSEDRRAQNLTRSDLVITHTGKPLPLFSFAFLEMQHYHRKFAVNMECSPPPSPFLHISVDGI